jgi:hypothetical protein
MSIDRPILLVLLANSMFAGASTVVIGTAVLLDRGPSALLLAAMALGAWSVLCAWAGLVRLGQPGRIYLW